MKTPLITIGPEIHRCTPVFAGTRVPVVQWLLRCSNKRAARIKSNRYLISRSGLASPHSACGLYPIRYNCAMYIVRETDEFRGWLDALQDKVAQIRIAARLRYAEAGNLGDWHRLMVTFPRCESTLGLATGFTSVDVEAS